MTTPNTQNRAATPVVALVVHAQALQSVLTDLSTLTGHQLVELFRQHSAAPKFPDILREAFPHIIHSHADAAAQVTAQWYDELSPRTDFRATPKVDLPPERIEKTINWALHAPTQQSAQQSAVPTPALRDATVDLVPAEAPPRKPPDDVVLSRLASSSQRMVFDASRDTVISNGEKQKVKFARYASANACAFCRLMATRGPVYNTEQSATTVVGKHGIPTGTRQLGQKYHDACRCVAVPVPEGQTYEPPDYIQNWQTEYEQARSDVFDSRDAMTASNILAAMRRNTGAK